MRWCMYAGARKTVVRSVTVACAAATFDPSALPPSVTVAISVLAFAFLSSSASAGHAPSNPRTLTGRVSVRGKSLAFSRFEMVLWCVNGT